MSCYILAQVFGSVCFQRNVVVLQSQGDIFVKNRWPSAYVWSPLMSRYTRSLSTDRIVSKKCSDSLINISFSLITSTTRAVFERKRNFQSVRMHAESLALSEISAQYINFYYFCTSTCVQQLLSCFVVCVLKELHWNGYTCILVCAWVCILSISVNKKHF